MPNELPDFSFYPFVADCDDNNPHKNSSMLLYDLKCMNLASFVGNPGAQDQGGSIEKRSIGGEIVRMKNGSKLQTIL